MYDSNAEDPSIPKEQVVVQRVCLHLRPGVGKGHAVEGRAKAEYKTKTWCVLITAAR